MEKTIDMINNQKLNFLFGIVLSESNEYDLEEMTISLLQLI